MSDYGSSIVNFFLSTGYSTRAGNLQQQRSISAHFQKNFFERSTAQGKLLHELEQVENKFKAKSSAFGKIVNYGSGVSIDTDDVIYIENGTGFHSYTFNIKHDNAPENAPVENLVLSPLADGTYRELLLSYNLNLQEKQMLESGVPIDTHGKVTITELAQGTYNNGGIMSKTNMSCEWVEETQWNPCSSGAHNGTNANQCEFVSNPQNGTPPTAYVIVAQRCTALPADTSLGENGEGGGSGPQNGPGGLGSGNPEPEVPTMPNLPPKNSNPCNKIKLQRDDLVFESKMTDLQGKTGLTKETGYIQKWGGDYEYKDNASATSTANTLTLPKVASNTWIKAFMHTHIDDVANSETKGIKMFSPADAAYFMDLVQNAQTQGQSLSDPYAVMVTSTGNYQIRFTGNQYQIKTFTKVEKDSHNDPFGIFMADFMINSKKLELGFLKYIQKEMLLYGITLYRMNTDGTTTEIKLNADKTDTIENTCP